MYQVGGVHVSCMPACLKSTRGYGRGYGRGYPRMAWRAVFTYAERRKKIFKILCFYIDIRLYMR